MKKKEFPKFWFDSNEHFGYIQSVADLKASYILNQQPGNPQRTFEDHLLACKQHYDNNSLNFGLRAEHSGVKTLYEFLTENGVEIEA